MGMRRKKKEKESRGIVASQKKKERPKEKFIHVSPTFKKESKHTTTYGEKRVQFNGGRNFRLGSLGGVCQVVERRGAVLTGGVG